MLLRRLSWPAKEPLAPACGVKRVMSPMRPVSVGRVAMSTRLTAVAAPVRLELKTGSTVAETVTVSCTAMARTRKVRSIPIPSVTCTSSCVCGSKAVPVVPL